MRRITGYVNGLIGLLFFCFLTRCAAAGYVKEPLACKLYKDVHFPGFPQVLLSFEYYHYLRLKPTDFYFNTDKLHTQIYVSSLHILPVKDNIDLSNIERINLELWDSTAPGGNVKLYIPIVDWNRSTDHNSNINDLYIDQTYIKHVNVSPQLDNSLMTIKMNVEGIFPENPWWFDIEICFSAIIRYN